MRSDVRGNDQLVFCVCLVNKLYLSTRIPKFGRRFKLWQTAKWYTEKYLSYKHYRLRLFMLLSLIELNTTFLKYELNWDFYKTVFIDVSVACIENVIPRNMK